MARPGWLTLVIAVATLASACSGSPSASTSTSVAGSTGPETDWVVAVEDAIGFMEANHYRRADFDWVDIRSRAIRLVTEHPSQANASEGVRRAALATGSSYAPAALLQADRRPDLLYPSRPPGGRRLAGDIGYLDFAVGSDNLETFTGDVRRLVEFIDRDPVCGWVIDLRETPIGDLPGEIAALNPILGEGTVFGVERSDGTEAWTIDGGELLIDGEPTDAKAGPGYAVHRPNAPVAILTSSYTDRAGTLLVVAFAGRPHTLAFGEPTGANTLIYERFVLPDGAQLDVPSGATYDRLGRRFERITLPPDQIVLVAPDGRGDAVLEAATDWLNSTDPCASAAKQRDSDA